MNDDFEKNYIDVIKGLRTLKSIKTSDNFRKRFTTLIIPNLPTSNTFRPLYFLPFRLAFIIIILILVSGTGLVMAADKSHPGNLLYPVKKAVEKLQLTITNNPSGKTTLHMNNADKRVDELEDSIKQSGNREVENITSDYESQVKDAVRESHKVDNNKEDVKSMIDQKLEDQSHKLEDIKKVAPTESHVSIEKAIETSKTGQEEINQLQQKKPEEKSDNPNTNNLSTQNPLENPIHQD